MVLLRFYTSIMTDTKLRNAAIITGIIAIAIVGSVFIVPEACFVKTIFKFQALITGAIAGVSALIGAGIVYRAAMLPVEEARERDKRTAEKATAAAIPMISADLYNLHVQVSGFLKGIESNRKERIREISVPHNLKDHSLVWTLEKQAVISISRALAKVSIVETAPIGDFLHWDEVFKASVMDDCISAVEALADATGMVADREEKGSA